MKKRSSWRKTALIILCVILAVILTLMLAATAWIQSKLNMIPRVAHSDQTPMSQQEVEEAIAAEPTDPVDPNFTGPVLEPEEVEWTANSAPEIGKEDEIVNILLIGQDRRPGEKRARSDTMILCTINLEKKTLVLTSFQRDTYVQLPDGYKDNRLNVAYRFGGMEMLNETLELNFGIHVDGNFEVDFNRFIEIIDLVGGVRIDLTEAEANHLSKSGNTVRVGSNLLSGEEALAYARIRKIDNDFYRSNRQRKVLQSVLQSCKTSSPQTLLELLDSVLPLLATDMTDQEIMSLVMDVLPILKDLKVTSQHIPAKGTYQSASIRGAYVLLWDAQANREILQKTLLGE